VLIFAAFAPQVKQEIGFGAIRPTDFPSLVPLIPKMSQSIRNLTTLKLTICGTKCKKPQKHEKYARIMIFLLEKAVGSCYKYPKASLSGCSSGVERYLAKVEVVSSNLITRSIFPSLT
jgi:hypothetical protein